MLPRLNHFILPIYYLYSISQNPLFVKIERSVTTSSMNEMVDHLFRVVPKTDRKT